MNKMNSLMVMAWIAVALAGCHAHQEMQLTPEHYAKLRGIELVTVAPTRPFELVATVEGFGGKFTAKETMINGMIDEAKKLGARALIPMAFPGEAEKAGTAKPVTGLDLFVVTENGRTMTRGRAIRWTGN